MAPTAAQGLNSEFRKKALEQRATPSPRAARSAADLSRSHPHLFPARQRALRPAPLSSEWRSGRSLRLLPTWDQAADAVITPAPRGEAAGRLWDGLVMVAGTDGFFGAIAGR